MKRLILLLCTVSTLMVAQDIAGLYNLTGVDVLYTYISRDETVLTVTDAYGFQITQGLATIPAAVPFTTQSMQLTEAALSAVGINLFVRLNADNTGSIDEGSYYPDVETITDENGNCVTLQQVLPVTDDFFYSSVANGMADFGMYHPGVNVLGLPGISSYAGGQLGLLGLQQSSTFEDLPLPPEHPVLCGDDGSCFPFTVGDIDGSGTLEIYPDENLLGIPEYVPGGAPLTGVTGAYFLKEGLNTDAIGPIFPGNTDPDFYLEWHGVDGSSANLGWGEDPDEDEDGDGTWFDRIIGIPGITATYMNPACGFNQPIYGDVSDVFPPECVDVVASAATGYVMDPSGALATWGHFLTAHAAIYTQCVPLLGAEVCAGFGLTVDDSGSDVDPSCLSDYNPADLTTILDCAGRLTMNFDIPCVGVIEAREVATAFVEIGEDECGTGDMNGDGGLNVLDVVALVSAILEAGSIDCAGDMNGDDGLNVLDVVALVGAILGGGNRVDDATSTEFNVNGNEVTMTADGNVRGIQMTLSHGNDFALTLTDGGRFSDHLTKENTTTVIIVDPTDNNLFVANDNFTIESIIATADGSSYIQTSVSIPKDYSIGSAHPNPFNPTTQMSLNLSTAADVSVQVFNMNGQLVNVIANGNMASGDYNFKWDASKAPSGVYFIRTEIGSEVHSQKIMLIK